jgi:hypothetical protein
MLMRGINMHKITVALFTLLLSNTFLLAADPDFDTHVQKASESLQPVMPQCEEKMNSGDFAGANATLLAVFPDATRTSAQALVLGNVLFETDRKLSYALHQSAAKAEPQNPEVVFEWAMEQHRAGEYAGALASYKIYSQAKPQLAAPHAMQADCLLRLNRVNEAFTAWANSESAPSGSIEQMEDLVCAVHREPAPFERRANLLAKAVQHHDVDAVCDLIALDCAFPRDWWNVEPQQTYLSHDAPAVAAALNLPADDGRRQAMACAVEIAAAVANDPDDVASVKAILVKHHVLIDTDQTIPAHGGLLSLILKTALSAKVLDDAALRQQIGPKIVALAKQGHDVDLWNAAAFTFPKGNPDDQMKFERDGWQATADPRFAAGVLFLKLKAGTLTGNDPDL